MEVILHFTLLGLICLPAETRELQPGDFANRQRVTILGYNDHAMEPFISRDRKYLFFNHSNDPDVDIKPPGRIEYNGGQTARPL